MFSVESRFYPTQLPATIVESLDLATLELRPGSFLDNELQQYFSDLLFRVRLRTGRDAHVYILLEHKSYVERFVALQLLRYKVEIWEQARQSTRAKKQLRDFKLPPVFPLVVYHGKREWQVSQQFADLVDGAIEWEPYIPDFTYAITSVADIRETELFNSVLFRAALRLMRHIFDPDLPDKLPGIWAEFRNLAWGPETQGFLIVMLTYVTSATSVSDAELVRTLEIAVPEQEETLMATLARQWMEQGIEQGIERGLLSSIRTGLETRFGTEGEQFMEELAGVQDSTKLQQIVSMLFEANNLTEFQNRCRILLSNETVTNRERLN